MNEGKKKKYPPPTNLPGCKGKDCNVTNKTRKYLALKDCDINNTKDDETWTFL